VDQKEGKGDRESRDNESRLKPLHEFDVLAVFFFQHAHRHNVGGADGFIYLAQLTGARPLRATRYPSEAGKTEPSQILYIVASGAQPFMASYTWHP